MEWEALKIATKISISKVLETMFFSLLECTESGGEGGLLQIPKDQLMGASLKFSGSIRGKVAIVMPITLTRSLTADFLGKENVEVRPEEMEGTIKELLNMITGKAMKLFDEKSIFTLGIPERAEPAETMKNFFSENDDAFNLFFHIQGHQLGLRITIKP